MQGTLKATRPNAGGLSIQRLKSSLPPRRRAAERPSAGAGTGSPSAPSVPSASSGLAATAATTAPSGTATTSAPAATPLSISNRQRMCEEILIEGFVQSYVDFFYLTHRPDPNPDAALDNPDEQEIDVSLEDMTFIRDELCQAESARRKGETPTVFSCYTSLASHFQQQNDCKTGIYFYEKCLEIARLTADVTGEMTANHNLGLAYEQVDDIDSAIGFHERHLELAKEASELGEEKAAQAELVKMYRRQAESLEEGKEFEASTEMDLRCLAAAKDCGDRLAEGEANYRAGRGYVMLEEAGKAVPYLSNYLEITKELEGHEDGQGAAYAALAAAYEKLGKMDDVVDCLSRFLQIARDTENLKAQAEASSNLGVIHNRQGNFGHAVKFFEQSYDLQRSLLTSKEGTRKAVDQARVNLGMARGNARMGQYMNVINYDMSSLLQWKNNRISFEHPLLGKK